jgi:hypothetical protein
MKNKILFICLFLSLTVTTVLGCQCYRWLAEGKDMHKIRGFDKTEKKLMSEYNYDEVARYSKHAV